MRQHIQMRAYYLADIKARHTVIHKCVLSALPYRMLSERKKAVGYSKSALACQARSIVCIFKYAHIKKGKERAFVYTRKYYILEQCVYYSNIAHTLTRVWKNEL